MEFWGVEVKAGETLLVPVEDGHLIHVSQVALGDVKNQKSASYVPVRMKVQDKKFVIGTLSADKGPQISFDLVLDKNFELSHDWKDGSIYFCGYTAEQDDGSEGPDAYFDEEEDDSSDEEELVLENGKTVPAIPAGKATDSKAAATKPGASTKPKVTVVEPKKDESDDSDDSDEESEDDDVSGESDDDVSEDEETPQKVEPPSKKRPSSSAVKTPVSTKKAKTETPQKTDGKKGSVHTATPHPSKKSEKKIAESPKSSGVSCKTCSKMFNSEKGLESHTKAKHGGK